MDHAVNIEVNSKIHFFFLISVKSLKYYVMQGNHILRHHVLIDLF